jgi:hypothetical protein
MKQNPLLIYPFVRGRRRTLPSLRRLRTRLGDKGKGRFS